MTLIFLIAAMVIPNFVREIERERLPGSARQLRSLLTLVSANAAFDGKRYRIRFPLENEEDPMGGDRQPILEREHDPIEEPEVFGPVKASWTLGATLLEGIWCAEVRHGRPSIERLRERRDRILEALEKSRQKFEPETWPLAFEPDGTSDWAVFVLTDAPRDTTIEELENFPRIEVIWEGATGLAWLQRPFYDEELDLFEEKNWPAVLRQDFLDSRLLTEEDVLELRDMGAPSKAQPKEAPAAEGT